MNSKEIYTLNSGLKLISSDIGIINFISKVSYLHSDPKYIGYGIFPCDTSCFGTQKYQGRSSGNGNEWYQAMMATLGEVVERYCPAFYDMNSIVKSKYDDLKESAVEPEKIALFHERQYKMKGFPFVPFTKDTEVYWVKCWDLINGGFVYYPACMVFLPFNAQEERICYSTSTGMAGHINFYDAMLIGLYELIERDSFVITWAQELDVPKIKITPDIQKYLSQYFPSDFEFHFLDITFDIKVPTIMGICFGKAEYGDLITVGAASRSTYAEALKKVIKEIGQTIPYYRHFLGERKQWYPKEFYEVVSFEDHSLFYIKRKDCRHVFDIWTKLEPSMEIDFNEKYEFDTKDEIRRIAQLFKEAELDLLVKDLTTPDIKETGFVSVKMISPQMIQLGGNYSLYFYGGYRLYEVPKKIGKNSKKFEKLNKYPHPFP